MRLQKIEPVVGGGNPGPGADIAAPGREPEAILSTVLFCGLAVLMAGTCLDYGYSWDEVEQNRYYGQAVLRFIQTFGADQSALTAKDFFLYGGIFDALAELIPVLLPVDGFVARRFANIAMGMLAMLGTLRVAHVLGGPRTGFWSLLLLALIPAWYGHLFINAKDIPFAAGYIWSLYFILRIADGLPAMTWKSALGLGAAYGLAVGVRVGGVVVFGYLVAVIAAYMATQRRGGGDPAALRQLVHQLLTKILIALALAWGMMAAFWPAVLLHPVRGFVDALRATGHFRWNTPAITGSISVLLNGNYVEATDLPWYYLPVYFGVKLPLPILILFVIGSGWGLIRVIVALRRADWRKGVPPGLLLFAAMFPPLYAVLTGATIYDGIRHFLFILPPLACLAGGAMAAMLTRLVGWNRAAPAILYGVGAILVGFHLWTLIRLHPYQYAYLNPLGGGIPAGSARYETEYWITSYREAALNMADYARWYTTQEGIPFSDVGFDVAVFGSAANVEPFVPGNFAVTTLDQARRADFYIATTRYGADRILPDWQVIAKVERMGMLFAVVKTSLPPPKGEGP